MERERETSPVFTMKECIALKDFISPVFGNVDEGRRLPLEDRAAAQWEEAGLVRIAVDVSVAPVIPSVGNAETLASSSASQAVPASPKQTASASASGAKKISRMKSGA
jgi:hypothetical protein